MKKIFHKKTKGKKGITLICSVLILILAVYVGRESGGEGTEADIAAGILESYLDIGGWDTEELPDRDTDTLEVHFIDVGQGDATLILYGDSSMLIDAGDNGSGTKVQNYLKKQGVGTLDYLILTHPDEDHIGGADVILTKFEVNDIIMSVYEKNTATYRDVLKAMDSKSYVNTVPVPGDTYSLGNAQFTIIAPVKNDYEETNNYSVGITLTYGDTCFLFTGDAEETAEQDILASGADIAADVYKAAHHGSNSSSSTDFLDAIDPAYAVISCGENNTYGHPRAEVLNNLRSRGIQTFRTDEQGTIVVQSDGSRLTWNCAPSESWIAGEPAGGSIGSSMPREQYSTQNTIQEYGVGSASDKQDEAQGDVQDIEQGQEEASYVLNTKSKKFHKISCNSLPTNNREDSTGSRDEIIEQGYEPCKRCNP